MCTNVNNTQLVTVAISVDGIHRDLGGSVIVFLDGQQIKNQVYSRQFINTKRDMTGF